jgi:hypothetical protein
LILLAPRLIPSPAAIAGVSPAMLPAAASDKKRRRVGSRGGNIMGWSIADVFVGGVIYTRVAWVIGLDSTLVRVRAEAKFTLPLGLQLP